MVNSRGGRQVIPRPPGAVPGDPAPWSHLVPARRRELSLELVRKSFAISGRESPEDVQVPPEALEGYPHPQVPAAVLVPLFEEAGETRVILTRRSEHMRLHKGEVSFPGGRLDPGESPVEAALREAREEIGLDSTLVEILGRLKGMATLATGITGITPVVGVLPKRPFYRPNPVEVEHVFDVSLAELADPDVYRQERWVRPDLPIFAKMKGVGADGSFPVVFFELHGGGEQV